MDFEQMTRFATLAKHLNVTKAADELNTTQPNLSKHLQALEDALRGRLFVRHAKGLRLTTKGQELLSDVGPLVAQWQRIGRRYFNGVATQPEVARLKVAGTYGAGATLIGEPLALFQKVHPDVEVVEYSNSTVSLEELISAGRVELALCPTVPSSPHLTAEHYLMDRLVLFVAKSYALGCNKNLTLADVAKWPLLVREGAGTIGGTATLLDNIRALGLEPKIGLRSDHPEVIKDAVRQGSGVGALYRATIEPALRHGAFKALNVRGVDIEGQIYIVYHKTRPLSAYAEAFLRILREQREKRARNVSRKGAKAQRFKKENHSF